MRDKIAKLLMEHGVLKNADADRLAARILKLVDLDWTATQGLLEVERQHRLECQQIIYELRQQLAEYKENPGP